MPPPKINRNKPNTIANIHSIIPPLDLPIILQINPISANGIFNQFNQPKNGMKANNIPMEARMPNKRPMNFTIYFLCYV